MYLYTNKSPLLAVVVSVGAVSSVCSYAALNVIVLEPVPSCINNIDTNCPACALVAAPNVLLPPSVTFATGDVDTSHDIVDASVNVASALYAPTLNFAFADDNTNLSVPPVLKSSWSSVSDFILE